MAKAQQKIGLRRKGARDDDTLEHAGRQLLGIVIGKRRQADQIERVVDLLVDVFVVALDVQTEADVFADGEPLHGGVFLKDVGDAVLAQINLFAVEQNVAGSRLIQVRQAVQKRGFAAARRADDAQELAVVHVKGNVVQNKQVAEFLGQVGDLDFDFSIFHIHAP